MLTKTMTIVIDHLVDQYWPGSIVQGCQTVVAFHIDVGTVVNLGAEIGTILLDSYQKNQV